jgi:hypothetical protein
MPKECLAPEGSVVLEQIIDVAHPIVFLSWSRPFTMPHVFDI